MEELLLRTERGWLALLRRPYVRSDHTGAFQAERRAMHGLSGRKELDMSKKLKEGRACEHSKGRMSPGVSRGLHVIPAGRSLSAPKQQVPLGFMES